MELTNWDAYDDATWADILMQSSAMRRYRVLAQSCFSSRRITADYWAKSADAAMLAVGPELHDAGYYVLDIHRA